MYTRTALRRIPLLAVITASVLLTALASVAEGQVATFEKRVTWAFPDVSQPGASVQSVWLQVELTASPDASREQTDNLRRHLERLSTYTFDLVQGERFMLDKSVVNAPVPGGTISVWTVDLFGIGSQSGKGKIKVTAPAGWRFQIRDEGSPSSELTLDYSFSQDRDWKLPKFQAKFAPLEYGEGGFSLSASGEGVVGRSQTSLSTLSLDAQLPLGKPTDVADTPGAFTAASKENPGRMALAFNHTGYRRGAGKFTTGLKLLASGPLDNLQSFESVLYVEPLMAWSKDMHSFYGAEVEVGYRDGSDEWQNLTTKAPPRGNTVARLGTVVEWAPIIGGVNRDLSQGLRFFMRGRWWVDMFDNASGDTDVRGRLFADSELFFNFSKDYRFFVRAAAGYIPPDLTVYTNRVWAGIGKAF